MSLVGLYSVMNCNSEVTYSSEQDFFKQAVVQMVERLHQSQGWLFSPAHLLLYMFWGVLGEDKERQLHPTGGPMPRMAAPLCRVWMGDWYIVQRVLLFVEVKAVHKHIHTVTWIYI